MFVGSTRSVPGEFIAMPMPTGVGSVTTSRGITAAADDEPVWRVLVVEGVETGDRRIIDRGALSFVDPPMPFMAIDETTWGHDEAKLVAHIVETRQNGDAWEGRIEYIDSDDDKVRHLQRLLRNDDLPGTSVDMDSMEGVLEIDVSSEKDDDDPFEMPEADEDGVIRVPLTTPLMRVTKARVRGATAVPMPAFVETVEAVTASAALLAGRDRLLWLPRWSTQTTTVPAVVHEAESIVRDAVARTLTPPTGLPPLSAFDDPQLDGPTVMTLLPDGTFFGHVAVWDSCHRSFTDSCLRPPRSATNYAQYHVHPMTCAGGERLLVGHITIDSGHADDAPHVTAAQARAHYDNSGYSAAWARCGEDQWGIWMAGALRPGVTEQQLLTFMTHDVSGDWRSIGGNLELIALASVPVPGFVKLGYANGLVASMVAAMPVCDRSRVSAHDRIAERIAASVGRSPADRQAEIDRVAFACGRHPSQRLDVLRASVHREA